jgi:hypothetical protein
VALRRFSASESPGRRREAIERERGGGFAGDGAARGSFRAAIELRTLVFSFNACGAACTKYSARWTVISRAVEKNSAPRVCWSNCFHFGAKLMVFTVRTVF